MVGLELLDSRAVAVVIDEAGRVLARAQSDYGAGLEAAVFAVLAQVPLPTPVALGVTSVAPASDAAVGILEALPRRFPGAVVGPLIASGTAAVVAEAWIGAARGAQDVVFFGVDEHVSAGLLREGRPMTGARGRAPAIGWLALNPVEREDYRRLGCLEAEVGAAGIVRRLIWRVKAGDESRVVAAAGGELGAVRIDHVLAGARDGDGVAISVTRDTAKYLGMAAANLAAIADPATLVLGGIMAAWPDLLLAPVSSEIARRLPGPMSQALTIVPSALGADAPAIGAARLAAAALP